MSPGTGGTCGAADGGTCTTTVARTSRPCGVHNLGAARRCDESADKKTRQQTDVRGTETMGEGMHGWILTWTQSSVNRAATIRSLDRGSQTPRLALAFVHDSDSAVSTRIYA
jgi:hypothetical protein